MLETFHLETFQMGDKFKLFYGDNQFLEINLVKIIKSKYQYPITNRESFSLIFTSEKDAFINGGTYPVEQERVGCFELGLSPIIPYDQEYHYYEAAFQ